MIAVDLDLGFLSRVSLVAVCLFSCGAAGALAWVTHPKYTPHMVLISFWSFWAGCAMLTLAFDQFKFPLLGPGLLVANLNGAFVVALGGWASFAMRLWREGVNTRRAESVIARAMQEALDEGSRVRMVVEDD